MNPIFFLQLAQQPHLGDGGEQAAGVLVQVRRDRLAAEGKTLSEQGGRGHPRPVISQYEAAGSPLLRASARLWDDGVIDPAQSRTVLALALATCQGPCQLNQPAPSSTASSGCKEFDMSDPICNDPLAGFGWSAMVP